MGPRQSAFLDACAGRRTDRTPIWIMRQAGRYLPEYREIRSRVSFSELCRTPQLCAEVTVQPIERFDLDAAILFSDILVVFDALGIDVHFDPAPSIATPVRTESDLAKLRFGAAEEHLGFVFEAVRACRQALAGRVPLIGFCGAPLTTISYLVEGGATKDFEHTKGLMFRAPKAFASLMGSMTALLSDYLAGQVAAGVDAVQIFDSWAGALSPRDYREHALPHLRRLVESVGGLGVPCIVFARGNAELLEQIRELPADVLGIDWGIDLARAVDIVGRNRVVQGNLDPMTLLGPKALVQQRAREVLVAGKHARAHIFNLGHGISRATDPERVRLLVDTVHGG